MPDARYFIVQHDDRWTIKFNDEEYGPYKSKDEAMLFAIDAAQKLGEHGGNPEVVLMGEDGLRQLMTRAVAAATARSKELAK